MKRLVTLYTRSGCCLCEEAKRALAEAGRRVEFDYEEIDIDLDEELRLRYNEEVPVIAIDGVKAFKYTMTAAELLRKLEARR